MEVLNELAGKGLESVRVGDLSIESYAATAGRDTVDALKALAVGPAGGPGAPPELHGIRRGRRRAAPVSRAPSKEPGHRRPVEDHPRRRPLLQRDQGLPQRPPGGSYELDDAGRDAYLATNLRNSRRLDDGYDFVVVHDPQPLPIRALHGGGGGQMGVALPHRHVGAPSGSLGVPAAVHRPLRRHGVHHGRVRLPRPSPGEGIPDTPRPSTP